MEPRLDNTEPHQCILVQSGGKGHEEENQQLVLGLHLYRDYKTGIFRGSSLERPDETWKGGDGGPELRHAARLGNRFRRQP